MVTPRRWSPRIRAVSRRTGSEVSINYNNRHHGQASRSVRWSIFLDDCMRFFDAREPWAERAAELGWDSASLFGFRFERPHEHLGDAGLLWSVAGGKILHLFKDGATIAADDGRQRVFQRRPNRATTTLPWNLP